MKKYLERININIESLKDNIINHKVYAQIKTIEDLRIFMEHHVYAVWDFMSLLKTLQNKLTCVGTPWYPQGTGNTRYFINEIVTGEESDIDGLGNRKSHFEMYIDAMRQMGASISKIEAFIASLKYDGDFNNAYYTAQTPESVKQFIDFTFNTIRSKEIHVLASVFTFGREDLIPDMFMRIVDDIGTEMPETVTAFKYYLQRHIELDGDHHSKLAIEMVSELCGNDEVKWREAEEGAISALQSRIRLWDGVSQMLA